MPVTGLRGWCEPLLAVTAEAHFVGELGGGLNGRGVLRPHVRCPQTDNYDERNEAGGDPGRGTCNARPDAKIFGGGAFVRLGHDFPAQAGSLHTWISIMADNSTNFHSCLIAIYITVAGHELFD